MTDLCPGNVPVPAALGPLPGDEPLRSLLWDFNQCLDRSFPLDHRDNVLGDGSWFFFLFRIQVLGGLMMLSQLLGCIYVFPHCSGT